MPSIRRPAALKTSLATSTSGTKPRIGRQSRTGIWGLGTVLGRSKSQGLRGTAGRLFELRTSGNSNFSSPRAWAFSALGLQEYLDSFPGDRAAVQTRDEMAYRLLDIYASSRSPGWNWFEDVLAYSNARLPQALLACASRTSDKAMLIGRSRISGLVCLDAAMRNQRTLRPHRIAGLLPQRRRESSL